MNVSNPASSMMIDTHVTEEILARLARAEREHGVRIVLAVESGSRAWGFASPNSDYDARFIYVNRPEWYLSVGLEEQRDVIEYPIVDELDINGWDLRKALRLFWKSNPAFIEWIQSPLIYRQTGSFLDGSRALMNAVYSTESGMYHYRSMAKTNFRGYLQTAMVPLKKYFMSCGPCWRCAGWSASARPRRSNSSACSCWSTTIACCSTRSMPCWHGNASRPNWGCRRKFP